MACEVLIAGAGPSGLSAALFLSDHGIRTTVLERDGGASTDPRAATFHPPTLEVFAPSGVTAELHRRGLISPTWQRRDRKTGLIAEFDLGMLADETQFPYRLQCEQHKLVDILLEKLRGRPSVDIRFGADVHAIHQHDDRVEVETSQGLFSAPYLIGADGGRSIVRKSQEIEFEGFTYPERFLVITCDHDFGADGFAISNYVSDPDEWCAVFKVPADRPSGLWRVVFPTDPEAPEEALLSVEAAYERLTRLLPTEARFQVTHVNLYQVHQRVASTFRKGRVLLIGDAAHINNPLGGMGMNFGIHDAASAAEALAGVLRNGADEGVLDRFDRRRRSVANDFLQRMTIQNKRSLEERDPVEREKTHEAMRKAAADPAAARAFLLETSMIASCRAAAAID